MTFLGGELLVNVQRLEGRFHIVTRTSHDPVGGGSF